MSLYIILVIKSLSVIDRLFAVSTYHKSQSTVSMVPKKVSLQLSPKQSIGDVWIAQLDRYRVPQRRSSGCNSSVAIAAVCSWYNAGLNVS